MLEPWSTSTLTVGGRHRGLPDLARRHGSGIEHVDLVHLPWFDDDTSELGASYFRAQGFDAER